MVNGEFPANVKECLSQLREACKQDGDITLNVFRAGDELEIKVKPAPLTDEQNANFLMDDAKAGNSKSQVRLGYNYYNGIGVEKDIEKAIYWYRKAAEQGEAHAQENLGRKYYVGRGVKQDYKEALKWYLMAAEQGLPGAQRRSAGCTIVDLELRLTTNALTRFSC